MSDINIPFSNCSKMEFAFPKYKKIDYSPNLNAYIVENENIKAASCSLVFHRGAYEDNTQGLSSLSSRGLTRGTINRSPELLAQEVDHIGAYLNSHGNWDSTTLGVEFLADKREKAIELYIDCVLNANYPENEVENFRRIHLSELDIDSYETNYLAFQEIQKSIFNGSPYSNPKNGTRESIEKIAVDEMRNWRQKLLNNSKKTLFISIDKNGEQLAEMLAKQFDIPLENSNSSEISVLSNSKPEKPLFAYKDSAPQASIRVGKLWKTYSDEGFKESQILNTVFGGYFLSRLNETIRVKRGFSYGAFSDLTARKRNGAMIISANLSYENLDVAFDDIYNEIKNLYENKIDESELNQAKQYFLGSFARAMETPNQALKLLQALELYNLPANHYENLFNFIKNANSDSIYETQRKLFAPTNWHIAVSGDQNELNKSIQIDNLTKFF